MTRKQKLKKSSELLSQYSQQLNFELEKKVSSLAFGLQLQYLSPHISKITGYIIFRKGLILEFDEILEQKKLNIVKTKYRYHLMDKKKQLIFRYDNVAHHPEIKTHPHHKHTTYTVITSHNPNLLEVVEEIERLLLRQKE